MAQSFVFYDLETSGFNAREARVMQFASQRTDMKLKPIGEAVNVLITMSDDMLPDPDAVLITGLTPQATIQDGITEAAFLKLFHAEVATPDTIFVGFNSIRFDDEFMRFLHYRNFYDAYEWQWQDGRSRWDLLDVTRMTRALRPTGIVWPLDAKNQPANRLELLAAANKLDHQNAHDALSDVQATIGLARLLKTKQPKLFEFLLRLRDKKLLAEFVSNNPMFLYTSGKYPGEFEKTTVVHKITDHPKRQAVLVYDLRIDPQQFQALSPQELAAAWRYHKDEPDKPTLRLPVKTLQYNRCPAVAPLSVLDTGSQKRLKIDLKIIKAHQQALRSMTDFPARLLAALAILDAEQEASYGHEAVLVDAQLYDGFIGDHDRQAMSLVRAASPAELGTLDLEFQDHRLKTLLPLYKARNYPKSLTDEERSEWEAFRTQKLTEGNSSSRAAKFGRRLAEITTAGGLSAHQEYLLEELRLWGESVMPTGGDE